MLCVKVIVYCAVASAVRADFDLGRKSIRKCGPLRDSLLQLLCSLKPSASSVAFAVPDLGNSSCSETILTSAAQKSASPLLVMSNSKQAYHVLSAKLAMTVLVGSANQIMESMETLRTGYIWDAGTIVVAILEKNHPADVLKTVGRLQQAFVRRFRILAPVSDEEVAVWSAADPAASICGRPGGAVFLGLWKSTEIGSHLRLLTKLPEEPSLKDARCPLRVLAFFDAPFVLYEDPPRGLDIEVMKFLADETGSQLEFISTRNNFTFSAHPDDSIIVDGLRLLDVEPVDSMLGCVTPTKLRSRLLTLVQAYFSTYARFWVREIPSVTQPVPSNAAFTWPALFVLWMIITWLLKLFPSGLHRRSSFVTTWGIMMEIPSTRVLLPISFQSRVFLSLFLLCTIVTNTDIRSSLTSVLATSGTQPEFRSYEDLVTSDAAIGFSSQVFLKMFGEGLPGTEHDKAVFYRRRTVDCMGSDWPGCYKRFTSDVVDKSFAFFATRTRMRYIAHLQSKLYPSLDQPSLSAMCSLYLRKGSPWADRFKELIFLAAAAGLKKRWMRKSSLSVIQASKCIGNRPLRMENFVLAFKMLGLGLAGATGVLGLELLFIKTRYRFESLFQLYISLF